MLEFEILSLQYKNILNLYEKVSELEIEKDGIQNSFKMHYLRQLLIISDETKNKFTENENPLKENLIVKIPEEILYNLESGTEIKINDVILRLTYLCEPCYKIPKEVSLKNLKFKRGYLANILKPGKINLNNYFEIGEINYEKVPHEMNERVKWFLDKVENPVSYLEIVGGIGLSKSYCRVIPRIVDKLGENYKVKVKNFKYKNNY